MKAVIDTVFKRSRTTIMILVLILIAGTISYIDIPKEAAPDINIPIIYVTVSHRGISPEDAERLLVQPLEQELRSVEGVKEMRSTAFEGGANVLLEFDAGFDADQALLDVREQVDIAKPELPKDSDEPTVNEINFSQFPMFIIALSGAVPERALLRTAHKLKDEIEGIPAVLEVDIGGDRDEQVEIIIDPSLVQSYGLSSFELVNFFTNSNKLVAAGIIDNGKGRFSIKVPGLIETVQEVMDFPVKIDGDAVVRLKDIATGRRAFEDAKE
ncbi:MAG: efflux RND transporter permease subunit, partial [Alphaproteobacteria bacterium]|nr:efflux RND transporter permease subunit [Alphaproteobacteria bacterium]